MGLGRSEGHRASGRGPQSGMRSRAVAIRRPRKTETAPCGRFRNPPRFGGGGRRGMPTWARSGQGRIHWRRHHRWRRRRRGARWAQSLRAAGRRQRRAAAVSSGGDWDDGIGAATDAGCGTAGLAARFPGRGQPRGGPVQCIGTPVGSVRAPSSVSGLWLDA